MVGPTLILFALHRNWFASKQPAWNKSKVTQSLRETDKVLESEFEMNRRKVLAIPILHSVLCNVVWSKETNDDSSNYTVNFLTRLGFQAETAESVAKCNAPYFRLLFQEDKNQLDVHLNTLSRLVRYPQADGFIRAHPEMASLLAGVAAIDANGVENVLSSAISSENYEDILKLYEFAGESSERAQLANILKRDGDLILNLSRKGVIDPISWFVELPVDPEAASIYRRWVRVVIEEALSGTESEKSDSGSKLHSAFTLLAIHSKRIRTLLNSNPVFRQKFLTRYWPVFHDLISDKDMVKWGNYINDNHYWDYCVKFDDSMFDMFKLFKEYGSTATDILLAPEYQDHRIMQFVNEALVLKDADLINDLRDPQLRQQLPFQQLLARNLTIGTKRNAIKKARMNMYATSEKLRYYQTLSDDALKKELGPEPSGIKTWIPGYSIYHLGRKFADGRETSGMDVAFATFDVVTTVPALRGLALGLPMIQKKLAENLLKTGSKELAEQVSKKSAKDLYPWVIKESFRVWDDVIARMPKLAPIDITQLVRNSFRQSGLNNNTFKRLTRLDARVFMRNDRKVVFDFPKLVSNKHAFGLALRETAINGGFEEAIKSEPGKVALEKTVQTVPQVAALSQKQLESWRQHLSIWWLANNDSVLAKAGI